MVLLPRPLDSLSDPPGYHYGKVFMHRIKQFTLVKKSHHLSHFNRLRHRVSNALLKAYTACLRAVCETNLGDGESLITAFRQVPLQIQRLLVPESTSSILKWNKDEETLLGRFEERLTDPVFKLKYTTLMIDL